MERNAKVSDTTLFFKIKKSLCGNFADFLSESVFFLKKHIIFSEGAQLAPAWVSPRPSIRLQFFLCFIEFLGCSSVFFLENLSMFSTFFADFLLKFQMFVRSLSKRTCRFHVQRSVCCEKL
ncbi:hypothetical protein PAEPH01_2794 [Pancytospora epiphaga]|nr:hypothetical protein PAEPH01_2794 [Pancytospora epiphaga]